MGSEPSTQANVAVTDDGDIISAALQALRPSSRVAAYAIASDALVQRCALRRETAPLFGHLLAGRPGHRVTFQNVGVLDDGVSFRLPPWILVFDLYVDSATKMCVRLDSRWPPGVRKLSNWPQPAVELEHFTGRSAVVTGIPPIPPPVGVLRALKIVAATGLVAIERMKQVQATYCMTSRFGRPARPEWIIGTLGLLDPWDRSNSHTGLVPIRSRDQLVHVIDGLTGEWLHSTTP